MNSRKGKSNQKRSMRNLKVMTHQGLIKERSNIAAGSIRTSGSLCMMLMLQQWTFCQTMKQSGMPEHLPTSPARLNHLLVCLLRLPQAFMVNSSNIVLISGFQYLRENYVPISPASRKFISNLASCETCFRHASLRVQFSRVQPVSVGQQTNCTERGKKH